MTRTHRLWMLLSHQRDLWVGVGQRPPQTRGNASTGCGADPTIS